MAPPGNGIFVVRGELSTLLTAMRRGNRWNSHSLQDDQQNPLMKPLVDLKVRLNQTEDLRLVETNEFLTPFLNIVKSENTTGTATSLALSAVNKFLSYGLIDPTHGTVTQTVENIAYAVTHARFVGTDQASDAVVLMKIVQVLRTLMLSPEGSSLTNESVCEVMLSCFRICFEPRLNEILRRSAEQALRDMVLLLFMRLPQFAEDCQQQPLELGQALKMVTNEGSSTTAANGQRRKSKVKPMINVEDAATPDATSTATVSEPAIEEPLSPVTQLIDPKNELLRAPKLSTTPSTPAGNIVDMRGKIVETPNSSTSQVGKEPGATKDGDEEEHEGEGEVSENDQQALQQQQEETKTVQKEEYINSVGVRFTPQQSRGGAGHGLQPYGLPCIRELFRFLVSLCNPLDKQNTDVMIHMGLNLLTVALEIGADSIGNYESLLAIVRDDMCRYMFFLLSAERLSIFAADLQLCFLLFESLRSHLKFQLEFYLTKLADIIGSDVSQKTSYETRELALENVLQLWRIPGFATELYINYDCDLYCSNLFEDMTKLLSKNALSPANQINTIHLLSADALVTVVELIEKNCAATQKGIVATGGSRHSRNNSTVTDKVVLDIDCSVGSGGSGADDVADVNVMSISKVLGQGGGGRRTSNMSGMALHRERDGVVTHSEANVVSHEQLAALKEKKRILSQGTELFNNRAEKGIQYLQENGLLSAVLDPREVAHFLRENAGLDKKQIGEYVSKKKNVECKILENFVKSFDFANMRIDAALRIYLETFRLPGEAPLISLVMEHFAEHWHLLNGEPFAHVDAAFGLAYAVIMLNMDQHNHNVKKMNIPMTVDDFVKNLRGMNGKADFDQEMLVNIYNSIKNEEIVMPAEQTGLIRESYLWKVLLRRGATKDGHFSHVSGAVYDKEIFRVIWGPTLSALSYMFDKRPVDAVLDDKAVHGFAMGATIAATHNLSTDFDALILTLCKFTTLLNGGGPNELTDIQLGSAFGVNQKAQLATRTVFGLVQKYGDCMRESWRNIFEIIGQLFKLRLLPKSLIEVEDFSRASGKLVLIPERIQIARPDGGLFSSLYSYLSSDNQRQPSYEEQERIKVARKCIKECRIEQIMNESKFLHQDSLAELLRALEQFLRPPRVPKNQVDGQQVAVAGGGHANGGAGGSGTRYEEDVTVFMLEIMVKVLIQNRDRLLPIWDRCKRPLYTLLYNNGGYDQLLLRTTVAIFKLSAYLMRNEELCPVVLQSLRAFLKFQPRTLMRLSRPISIGVYELLKRSAQNIHTEADWSIVFAILECVGAGAAVNQGQLADEDWLDAVDEAKMALQLGRTVPSVAHSDGALSDVHGTQDGVATERGYTSDSEVISRGGGGSTNTTMTPLLATTPSPAAENWILVNEDTTVAPTEVPTSPVHSSSNSSNSGGGAGGSVATAGAATAATTTTSSLVYPCQLLEHSPFALVKCWDSLAFIVRNVAHITPYNFEGCVKCIRTFVEASILISGGTVQQQQQHQRMMNQGGSGYATTAMNQQQRLVENTAGNSDVNNSMDRNENGSEASDDAVEDEKLVAERYPTIAIQLLDIMHALHTRTAQIFRWWAEEGGIVPQCATLWSQGWCPLLQGIARLATDERRPVRTYAITCLQRALLVHDLQTLSGPEWASCFHHVLFPLLTTLLQESDGKQVRINAGLIEESRMRTATIMSKVFLHHLTPLMTLVGFTELWLEILEYMERFMRVGGSDMLSEAMLEGLKNMLLVMHSVRVFHLPDGVTRSPLWELTWQKIGQTLPHLRAELFKEDEERKGEDGQHPAAAPQSQPPQMMPEAATSCVVLNGPDTVGGTTTMPEVQFYPQQTVTVVEQEIQPQQQQHPQEQEQQPPSLQDQQQQQQLSMDQMGQVINNVEANAGAPAAPTAVPGIPMSHLMAVNQYPSLVKAPPPHIVQSYAPMYVPHGQQQMAMPMGGVAGGTPNGDVLAGAAALGSGMGAGAAAIDIYNDYVNDPYNLTLPSHTQVANNDYQVAVGAAAVAGAAQQPPQSVASVQTLGVSNVFQSSNYFGTDTVIPPGSEMLFGGP